MFNEQNMDLRRHIARKAEQIQSRRPMKVKSIRRGREDRNLASDAVFAGKTYCKIVKVFFQPKSNASPITAKK